MFAILLMVHLNCNDDNDDDDDDDDEDDEGVIEKIKVGVRI